MGATRCRGTQVFVAGKEVTGLTMLFANLVCMRSPCRRTIGTEGRAERVHGRSMRDLEPATATGLT